MRMARLKYKLAESSAEFIACPSVVFIKQYSDTGNYALFHSGGFGHVGELAMPLDEAIEELNAAMAESLPAVDVPFYLKREAKVLNEPISTLGLFTTAYNACVKNNIRNIRDLTDATEADLSKLPRLGSTCLREIRNKLSNFGLHIGCTRND